MRPVLFLGIRVIMVKALMRHVICLSGLIWIHVSSRSQVVFLDVHSLILVHCMLDLAIPIFGVTCIILLTMILIPARIMHVC